MDLTGVTFVTEMKVKNDMLTVNLIARPELSDRLEYAYYLFCNKQRLEVKWYTGNPTVSFKMTIAGIYYVACFIKAKGEQQPRIIESEKYRFIPEARQESLKVFPISIFGSCVSRDLLEYDTDRRFFLKTYVARQSVVSAVSPQIACEKDQILLESEFQKKVVYYDITKKTFELFQNDLSSFLIIDLIDERFDLAHVRNSFVTLSNEMLSSGFLGKNPNKVKKIFGFINPKEYYVENYSLKAYLDIFCEKISCIYSQPQIIIHRAVMLNEYIDKNNKFKKFPVNYLSNNKKINTMLNYMYDYLQHKLPNAFVIDICKDFYADENHKWGLAPMHYQKEYYYCALERIVQYLDSIGGKELGN